MIGARMFAFSNIFVPGSQASGCVRSFGPQSNILRDSSMFEGSFLARARVREKNVLVLLRQEVSQKMYNVQFKRRKDRRKERLR